MAGFENERALIVCAVSTPEQAADDKESMEAQEREGLEWCAKEGCDVVAVVRIPGFSRSYLTFRELMEAAEAKGEYGPTNFWEHIQRRDFTLMVVRATNRFNREQSLNAEVMARVIRIGATIFSFIDGHIHKGNYRGMAAITGYRDATELDDLKKKRAQGIIGRAKAGVPISGNPPMSHRMVFNPATGEEEGMELRQELVPLWRDLATLLLENVAYHELERELFSRWGYGRGSKPYPVGKMHFMLFNALFWGNNVIRWQDKTQPHWKGVWVFDPSVRPPDGVEMFWNTHEPVYRGEIAELIKAELHRRTEVWNGSATRFGIGKFTGLVVCEKCHNPFSYARRESRGKHFAYMNCSTFRSQRHRQFQCPNRNAVRENRIQDWLEIHMEKWVKKNEVVIEFETEEESQSKKIQELEGTVTRLEKRLNNLIELIADADEDLRNDYRGKVRLTKDELNRANEQILQLKQAARDEEQRQYARKVQLSRIKELGLDKFWLQDSLAINQALTALLDNARLVAWQGQIIGFADSRDLAPPPR